MPVEIIETLLPTLIPILVKEAESLFGSGTGDKKRQYVIDGVHDVLTSLENKSPKWAGVLLSGAEPLIDDGINLAMDKLGL